MQIDEDIFTQVYSLKGISQDFAVRTISAPFIDLFIILHRLPPHFLLLLLFATEQPDVD